MATNVTEKDKTLQEIIDWCKQLEIDGLRLANALLMQRDIDQVLVPTAKGDKLRCLYDVSYGDKRNSYRRRPASEMLYAMIEANGKRTN